MTSFKNRPLQFSEPHNYARLLVCTMHGQSGSACLTDYGYLPQSYYILQLVLAHHQVHISFQMGMQPTVVHKEELKCNICCV